MTPLPEKFGKYHVLGLAGHGSMGTVFVGYDPFADRDVAIKACSLPVRDGATTQRQARKLFFNEAHTAGALVHPNILRVLDAGEERGQPYIVMEYVDGGATLQAHCSPGALLPVARVADLVARCAGALDYAHRRGVIHRDIKPGNIMLTPDGDVKIGDFGIAQRSLEDTTHVTGVIGSPRYMSPEQARELPLTGQTDIYSLGVVLYELLTGRPPFTATNMPVLFRQIAEEPPPPLHRVRPTLPPALEAVVARALEKDPAARHACGAELAAELAALFPGEQPELAGDPTETDCFEQLRRLHFFNDFADGELLESLRAARWITVSAGRGCRLPPGEHTFVVVVSGEAELVQGARPVTALGPGDGFGMGGVAGMAGQLRARSDCVLLVLAATALERTSPGCQLRFNRALLHGLVRRLSGTGRGR